MATKLTRWVANAVAEQAVGVVALKIGGIALSFILSAVTALFAFDSNVPWWASLLILGLMFYALANGAYRFIEAVQKHNEPKTDRELAGSPPSAYAEAVRGGINVNVGTISQRADQRLIIDQEAAFAARYANTKIDLQCIAAKVEDVELTQWHEIAARPDGEGIPAKAAIATFRRNPDEPTLDWIDIRTQIEFRAPGQEPILIPEGRWLGYQVTHAAFKIQSVKRLGVALMKKGQAFTYEGPFEDTGHYGIQVFRAEFRELTEPFYDVEIHLFGTKQRYEVTVNEKMLFELLVPEGIFRPKPN